MNAMDLAPLVGPRALSPRALTFDDTVSLPVP